MKYQDIKEFSKRCDEHPDHQDGMISNSMIQQRLHEEIYELRKYLEREWVGLTGPEVDEAYRSVSNKEWAIGGLADARVFLCAIEAKLKEKNT